MQDTKFKGRIFIFCTKDNINYLAIIVNVFMFIKMVIVLILIANDISLYAFSIVAL